MGAGIAANPHCPSYRRRRVAWRLPLGGSGRGRDASCRSPVGALRAEARKEPFGVSHQTFRPGLDPFRRPAGAGARAGLRRFQPGAEAPEPVPFGSGIGASPSTLAIGFRSKRAPTVHLSASKSKQASIFHLSASERSELRSSAASINEGGPPSQPAWPRHWSKLLRLRLAVSNRSKLRSSSCRLRRAETRLRLPVPGRSKLRCVSGRTFRRSKLRLPALPPSLRRGDSRFGSGGCNDVARRLPALPGGFSKSDRASACAYAGPASSTVLASSVPTVPFEGNGLSAIGGFRSGWVRFRAGSLPSTHASCHVISIRPSGFRLWITRITGVSF